MVRSGGGLNEYQRAASDCLQRPLRVGREGNGASELIELRMHR
jgi:hypothetical protein